MSVTFKDLLLDERLQVVIEKLGFVQPTEVQKAVLPLLLERDAQDLRGQAQTGTGKTLAFGLPLIKRIITSQSSVQGLVVVPTRELATQVYESLKPFARALGIEMLVVCGGSSMSEQLSKLRRGVHIVIGTPGRLNDHVMRGTLNLFSLKTLVLDEADIMFDMGFRSDIEQLMTKISLERELWLFSATNKSSVEDFSKKYMTNPVTISIGGEKNNAAGVAQYYAIVPFSQRSRALARFVDKDYKDFYGFVFCQTKLLTAEVAEELIARGYRAGALHGDMGQDQRNLMIKKFRDSELKILVATDVAARGIDIPDLTHVINYSIPDDQETYVHRIGRTGRAGKTGIAITFVSKSELRLLDMIKRKFKLEVNKISIPTREMICDARLATASDFLKLKNSSMEASLYQKLKALVESIDANLLSDSVVSLLYDKFFKDIVLDNDLPDIAAPESFDENRQADIMELSVSVGLEDGFSIDDIKNAMRNMIQEHVKKISRIRVSKHKTFIDIDTASVEAALAAVSGKEFSGKVLTVHAANPQPMNSQSRSYDSNRRYSSGGKRTFRDRNDRDGSSRDGNFRDGGRNRYFNKNESSDTFRSPSQPRPARSGGDEVAGGYGRPNNRTTERFDGGRPKRYDNNNRDKKFTKKPSRPMFDEYSAENNFFNE